MNNEPQKTELTISYMTMAKIFSGLVLAYFFYILAPVLLLIFIALLIAITLNSIERFLINKGWRKSFADIFLILILFSSLGSFLFFIVPAAMSQAKDLLTRFPEFQAEITKYTHPAIKNSIGKLIQGSPETSNQMWSHVAGFANQALMRLFEFAMVLITALYMFLDGKRGYNWILAFFNDKNRKRLDETCKEMSPIVESYIIGQAITSTMAATWVFAWSHVIGIPGGLTLAVLAAVFDILPGVGFIMNIAAAGLLGLTVSTDAAFMMVLAMMAYSAIENYFLIPHIYGSRLKLSPMVVLLSLIISGAVAGLPGMIIVLPIVAAYEPIERLWLKRQAGMKETVERHEKA